MIFSLFIDFSIPFFAVHSLFFIRLIKLSGKYFHKEIFAHWKLLVQMIPVFFSLHFWVNSQCFEWINLLYAFGNVSLTLSLSRALLILHWWHFFVACIQMKMSERFSDCSPDDSYSMMVLFCFISFHFYHVQRALSFRFGQLK